MWHSAGWTISLAPVLPNVSGGRSPSAPASSPLIPADDDVHHMRVVGATDPVQQPTPTTCPTGPVSTAWTILLKGQDQGDLGALDGSRCGRFHPRLPRWLIGAGSGNLGYSDYTPDVLKHAISNVRRGLWELGLLRLHSRCFEACHQQCDALVSSGTCEIFAEM